MPTPKKPIRSARVLFIVLFATLTSGLLIGSGCSGRTAPVTSGPTSSGGSTAPPAAPAPPESVPPPPSPTRGAAVDFAKTPPTAPPGR